MARTRRAKGIQLNMNTMSGSITKPITENQLSGRKVDLTKTRRHRERLRKTNLIVRIEKSKLIESLIQNRQADNGMESKSVRHNIPKSNMVTVAKTQPSTEERSKLLHSLKITTQLNSQTRKIDMIPLPPETVSMKFNVTPPKKTVRKKFLWIVSSDVMAKMLGDVFITTSSSAIFKNASLDVENSLRKTNSLSKITLSRASSVCNLDSISPSNSSRPSDRPSPTKTSGHERITLDRCTTPENITPSVDYDHSSREATQITSDSSGYHSEHKLSDISPASSTVSSPKRHGHGSNYTNCFVTSSRSIKDRLTLTPVIRAPINTEAVPVKRKFDFKTPSLPMSKRPPSRIKPMYNTNNVRAWKNTAKVVQEQNELEDDNSDAISLYAESITDENPKHDRDLRTVIDNKQTNSISASPVSHAEDNSKTKCDVVNTPVLETTPCSNSLPNTFVPIETHTNKVDQWIASAPCLKEHVNLGGVMNTFKKLCYFHYVKGKCRKDGCRYIHHLPKNFQNTLRDMNESQFKKVVSEIVQQTYLFKECFDMLLMYHKEKDSVYSIIYIIQDVLNLNIDKTPFIKKVILTLKDMGFSFVEAVEEILLTHGRKTESLLDILLMFIVEEEDCLENNWHFIDKLTRFRENKLDYGVVSEIFQKCCNGNPPNKQFCENIYKDLIIKNHVELDKIDRNLVIKYINMLFYFNLSGYAEQLMQYNGIGEHEVIKAVAPKTQQHSIVHTVEIQPAEAEIECFRSFSSSSSNSSSSSSTGQSNNDEKGSSAHQESIKNPSITNESEEMINFSFEHGERNEENVEIAKEVEELEEEESPVNKADASVEHASQNFDVALEQNYAFNNYDLDAYLNNVNRSTYSSNYYVPENTPSAYNNTSISPYDPVKCVSPLPTERSTPIQGSKSINDQVSPARNVTEGELSNAEIVYLMSSLNKQDLSGIFSAMKKSVDSNTCRSFIVHSFTTLKNMQPSKCRKLILDIFENLEILHSVNLSLPMKSLTRLLAFNVLPVLDRNKEYGTAVRLLDIYMNDLDSFLDTTNISNYDWMATKKLRYIFIFKIFIRAGKLKEVLKLLKSKLDLFQDIPSSDNIVHQADFQKRILQEFMETALLKDVQIARELIFYLMLNMDSLKHISLEKYLNLLLVKLINLYSTYKTELMGLFDNIMNGWFKYLKKSVMRGIFITTYFDLSDVKLAEFFNLCVDRNIYEIHEGLGNSIDIPRNLVAEEIQYIIHNQFYKICRSNFPLENIIISTDQYIEADELTNEINVLTNSIVDSEEMIRRIQNVLSKLKHFPRQEKINTDTPGMIIFSYVDAKYFLAPYRTGLPPLRRYR